MSLAGITYRVASIALGLSPVTEETTPTVSPGGVASPELVAERWGLEVAGSGLFQELPALKMVELGRRLGLQRQAQAGVQTRPLLPSLLPSGGRHIELCVCPICIDCQRSPAPLPQRSLLEI